MFLKKKNNNKVRNFFIWITKTQKIGVLDKYNKILLFFKITIKKDLKKLTLLQGIFWAMTEQKNIHIPDRTILSFPKASVDALAKFESMKSKNFARTKEKQPDDAKIDELKYLGDEHIAHHFEPKGHSAQRHDLGLAAYAQNHHAQ